MYLSNSGYQLFYHAWEVDKLTAIIVIAHGLGEHSGRYQHLANYFNNLGYSLYAMDHLGHGRSEGVRGHINSFCDYTADLNKLISKLKRQYPSKKIHLLGHSMGGLISTAYALRYSNVDTLILSSPGYQARITPPRLKVMAGKLLAAFFPRLTISNELDSKDLSRSKTVVEQYLNDPLVHNRISTKWYVEFLKETQFIADNLAKINLPCLMLVAQADNIVDSNVTESHFHQFSSTDKSMVCYRDAYHEIFNEAEEQQLAFSQIEQWLHRH